MVDQERMTENAISKRKIEDLVDYCANDIPEASYPTRENPPIAHWLLTLEDPQKAAEYFYRHLREVLMGSRNLLHTDNSPGVFETLTDKGVNVIDLLACSLHMDAPTYNDIQFFIPTVIFDLVACKHSHQQYQKEVLELDSQFLRALQVPTFVIRTSRSSGLSFADPKARLFAMVLGTDDSFPYLAHSPLMQACRQAWLLELKNDTSNYAPWTADKILMQFQRLPVPEVEEAKAIYRNFFLDIARGFSSFDFSDELSTKDFAGKRASRHELLGFSLDDRLEMAASWLNTGAVEPSRECMRSLFEYPDQFAEALVQAHAPQELMQDVFSHALFDYMYQMQDTVLYFQLDYPSTHHFKSLLSLIDHHRSALIDAGYLDIKASTAVRALAINLDVAEAFESLGYLPCEDMQLGEWFCTDGLEQAQSGQQSVPLRKMHLAIRLGQTQLIKEAVDSVFWRRDAKGNGLAQKESVVSLLESNWAGLADVLHSRAYFERALRYVSADLLLRNSAFEQYVDSALENELGL